MSTETFSRPLETKKSRAFVVFKIVSQFLRASKYVPYWQHYWLGTIPFIYQFVLFVPWYECATYIQGLALIIDWLRLINSWFGDDPVEVSWWNLILFHF